VAIDAEKSGSHCFCDGSYHLRFYKGDKLLLSLGWHHSVALRWHNGKWPGDAQLTEKSQAAIPAWFKRHGFPALAEEREIKIAAEREYQQKRARFQQHFPDSVKNFKDGKEVAAAVCRAFGTFKGHDQSWSIYTTDESDALSAIAQVSGEEFFNALIQLKADRTALLGAARFYFWDGFCDKIPQTKRVEWFIRLSEIALTDGWDGNKDLVLRRLSRLKDPQTAALLLDVFRGKVGKEVDFKTAWSREPGIRAGAALALSLRGDQKIKPEITKSLAKSQTKQDIAAFEICLALLGDPKFLKKEHFKLESYSIGYAGLEAIERHKGKNGHMEILIEER
jgi:hypothetical protein